jgi:hypothetical protein
VSARFQNGDALDTRFDEGFLDGVELGWLYDGFDFEHVLIPL